MTQQATATTHAAGIMFVTPAGEVLFLKRACSDHIGEWCFPGGHIEDEETAEDAACRESREEIGALPCGDRKVCAEQISADGVHFTTFRQEIAHAFTPRLSDEHTEHVWAKPGEAPQPLHPGVKSMLSDDPGRENSMITAHDEQERRSNGEFGSGGGSSGGSNGGATKHYDKEASLAGEMSKTAKSAGEHEDAAIQHWRAGTHAGEGSEAAGKHEAEGDRHRQEAQKLRRAEPNKTYTDKAAEAGERSKSAKTADEHEEAALSHWGASVAANHDDTIAEHHRKEGDRHRGEAHKLRAAGDKKDVAQDARLAPYERMAFDKGSTRRIDQDGRLYVGLSNISKANVCGYLGAEIPNGEALGLDPGKTYMLLRDPEELAKAVGTFNGLPILSTHVPVNAERPRQDLIIGSTGTDAVFEAPYLRNTLSFWVADAIEGIESEQKRELSAAYHYVAEMTSGIYEGTRYDGVMRNIRGNHVVTCPSGRAGGDVVVGDSKPLEIENMSKKAPPSRMSVLARGALLSVTPKLATDHKLDFAKLVDGVTAKNWPQRRDGIVAAVKPKLAQDANIEDVVKIIDALSGEATALEASGDDIVPAMTPAVDADPVEAILAKLRGKVSDEELKSIEADVRAACAPAPAQDDEEARKAAEAKEKEMKDNKPAMDAVAVDALVTKTVAAAVAANSTTMRAELLAQAREARAAEAIVRPYVGDLALAQDSADGVYKAALDILKVDVAGVHPSAYKAILLAQPKPGSENRRQAEVAMDSTPDDDFLKRFPNAARLM